MAYRIGSAGSFTRFQGPQIALFQDGLESFEGLVGGGYAAVYGGLKDHLGDLLRGAAHVQGRLDVQPQFVETGQNRQGRDGDELAGGVGNLFPGVHLPGDEQGQVPGQVLVEGSPQVVGAFVLDVFEVQFRGFLGLCDDVVGHGSVLFLVKGMDSSCSSKN